MKESYLKFMFNFTFPNKTDLLVEIEDVNEKVLEYNNFLLHQTKDNFIFKKDLYFHLTDVSCIIPVKIKPDINKAMYSCNMKFNSDEERRKYLNRFRKNLEDLSKSKVFKDDNSRQSSRIVMFDKYWFVY